MVAANYARNSSKKHCTQELSIFAIVSTDFVKLVVKLYSDLITLANRKRNELEFTNQLK